MAILITKDLCKTYGSGDNAVHALNHVSLTVEEGEFVSIVGTSGSGKSTFLNLVGGLDKPTSGEVWVRGHDLGKLNDEQLTIFRRRNIGFVFQNFNLIPMLNVYENITFTLEADGLRPDKEFLDGIIHALGLEEKRHAMPDQLSGGQRQRVAIARALAGLVPGLLAAMLLCLEVVPRALETLTNDNMSAMPRTVNFYPIIFLGTILFVALTVALSSWKPARLAGKISPMQALSYTGLPGGRRGKTGRRTGLRSMALHNVFRQKKQAVRVFASLTLGAVLILAVNSVFHLDMPEYDTNGYDITIYSSGETNSEEDTFAQTLNHSAMEAITQLDGIEEMEITQESALYMQSDPAVLWPYAKQFARWVREDDPAAVKEKMEAYQAGAGQFERTEAVILELSALEEYNQTAEQPVDLDAFAAGDTLLIYDSSREYVDPPEDFSGMVGQTLSICGRDGQVQSFTIGGVVSRDVPLAVSPSGNNDVPGILVSQAGMDRINPDADIRNICINAEKGQLMTLDQAIQEIVAVAPSLMEYVSVAQAQADYAQNQRTVALVGNGVCILMVLMGLMNYVNVMAASVQTRRRELAMMESLGMTRRQLRAMVMWEGGIYAVLSSVLFLAGGGILWAAFSDTHIDAGVLAFSFVWPPRLVAGLVLALLVLCPCISALAYRISSREPVIQRLHETS